MELHRYKEVKAKGGATMQRLGPNTYQIIAKRYDASTGAEQEPEIIPVNKVGIKSGLEQLIKQRETLDQQIASLEELEAEMIAMESEVPTP